MSTIEELRIQGIRSFGAKAEDAQRILFTPPLSLILGDNGCGKTTILECIKYALTGECPPGSDRGKTFVHDPNIFRLSDIVGQIKLQVRNIRGERVVVCRSMKVSNRRGKQKYETLDATMNYMTKGGKESRGQLVESISKRCVDVDLAMSDFMGVSKAIINNVIFCHQEHSNWPLDESKKLKEKFDAIFEVTEYNKLIEKTIKFRKEQVDQLKVKDANLRYLSHLKQEMEDKTMNLNKANEKCDAIMLKCNQSESELKPIEDRLMEIRNIENEIGKFQALRVQIDTKHKNCHEQITNLKKKIKVLFTSSLEDLKLEVLSFRNKMAEKKSALVEVESTLQLFRNDEKRIRNTLSDLDVSLCMTKEDIQKERRCISNRADKIESLSAQLDISITTDLNAEQSVDLQIVVESTMKNIEKALSVKENKISELKNRHEREDQQQQNEIDKLRVSVAKCEEAIQALKKQKVSYDKESSELGSKISKIEVSTNRLNKITEEIKRVDEVYRQSNEKFNQDEMRQAITSGKSQIIQLQKQFSKIDERLTFLNSISKSIAEISLKEKDLEKKEQEVRRIKSKHGDNLKKLMDAEQIKSSESNYRRSLQKINEKLQREIKDFNQKSNAVKLQQQKYEVQRKQLKDDIVRMEKVFEESKEKIYEKCHSAVYEDLLEKSKLLIRKYQMEHGALCSAEAMYKRYIKKMEEDPCCPLCHKGMSGHEVSDLSMELSDEIHQLPANINRMDKSLKAEQKKYEALLQLKPTIDKVAELETDIPKRKDALKELQNNLSKCEEESENFEMLLMEPTTKLDLANSMMGDMSLLDEATKEVSRIKVELEKLKKKLPQGSDTNESIEELQIEKSTVAAELEEERTKMEQLQQDYEKSMEALNKLREVKNNLKDEQIKLQEGVQALPEFKKRLEELKDLLKKTNTEIRNNEDNFEPLKGKLQGAISEKARQKELNRKSVSQLQAQQDAYKKIFHDIQRINNEVREYQKLNLQTKTQEIEQKVIKQKDILAEKAKEISATIENLDAIKSDLANQEMLERDLEDNRELKMLQKKEVELEEEKVNLDKQLGNLDLSEINKEKGLLIKKRDKITIHKSELLGQVGEINNQIKNLKREINEPKFKDSMRNYRLAHYEAEIIRNGIADLAQFRRVMEWALIRYHEEKMKTINKLIREHWKLIYRGNDIDYIEIQTDEGAGATTAAASDRRRNYNYRVVQSKNNVEMEMRGRCSAGQRVLASLIIRMALAETFSTNCGVLALDEPTTNLDRKNIISLCDALNRIVEDRQSQSNFMLIIITHDEDFISALGKITSYHRLFRNSDGKSEIRKVEIAKENKYSDMY